jgi:hypothetical protein
VKGWIYFILFGEAGPIKVRRSSDPVARARELNVASPVDLVLLGAMKSRNMEREERELHDRLSAFRIKREWFTIDGVAVGPIVVTARDPYEARHFLAARRLRRA